MEGREFHGTAPLESTLVLYFSPLGIIVLNIGATPALVFTHLSHQVILNINSLLLRNHNHNTHPLFDW